MDNVKEFNVGKSLKYLQYLWCYRASYCAIWCAYIGIDYAIVLSSWQENIQ